MKLGLPPERYRLAVSVVRHVETALLGVNNVWNFVPWKSGLIIQRDDTRALLAYRKQSNQDAKWAVSVTASQDLPRWPARYCF